MTEVSSRRCPRHGVLLTMRHLGPEDLPLCKTCYDEALQSRKGYEHPGDEILRVTS